MKIKIEVECELDDLPVVFLQIPRKVREQADRKPGCVCTAPEWADMIRDVNGNIIGSLEVK